MVFCALLCFETIIALQGTFAISLEPRRGCLRYLEGETSECSTIEISLRAKHRPSQVAAQPTLVTSLAQERPASACNRSRASQVLVRDLSECSARLSPEMAGQGCEGQWWKGEEEGEEGS